MFEKALRCFLRLRRLGRIFPAYAGFQVVSNCAALSFSFEILPFRFYRIAEPELNPRPRSPRIRPRKSLLFSDSFFKAVSPANPEFTLEIWFIEWYSILCRAKARKKIKLRRVFSPAGSVLRMQGEERRRCKRHLRNRRAIRSERNGPEFP